MPPKASLTRRSSARSWKPPKSSLTAKVIGGQVAIESGSGFEGGAITMTSGEGVASAGGTISLLVGDGAVDDGGDISMVAGQTTGTGKTGGNYVVQAGEASAGLGGSVLVNAGTGGAAASSVVRDHTSCIARCRQCGRCNFVSVSILNRDCSWFHTCRTPLGLAHPARPSPARTPDAS